MRKKIVAGNWKMNGTRDDAFSLTTEIKGMLSDEIDADVEVILAAPFVHLAAVAHLLTGTSIRLASQNCASENSGAYTGEVSASMIASVGANYVIIGHSERRSYFNEMNELLKNKIDRALENNLIPIFCIGETDKERESANHHSVIEKQLSEGVFHLDERSFSRIIIAYEPVWAIGTGKTATSEQAQEIHAFIRELISKKYSEQTAESVSILYGGSCNEKNAKELFSLPDVDGGLIGGASLKSRSFVNIIKSF